MLPMTDREYHRKQISDHLIKLKSQNKTHTRNINQSEYKTMQSIQTKLVQNDATIMSADKGNSLVIRPTQQYNTKVQAFINNNFQMSTPNPTKTFQNQIRKTTNCSTTLIPQDTKWKFFNLMEMFLGIVTGVLETARSESRIMKEQQDRNLDQITMMEGPPPLSDGCSCGCIITSLLVVCILQLSPLCNVPTHTHIYVCVCTTTLEYLPYIFPREIY